MFIDHRNGYIKSLYTSESLTMILHYYFFLFHESQDNQIPVCPLCNTPCPLQKGESPDLVVGRHIESDCLSDPAKERRKVYFYVDVLFVTVDLS